MKKILSNNIGAVDPKTIVLILAALIMLAIANYAFFTTTSTLNQSGMGPSDTRCSTVTNPSVAQNINIGTGVTVSTVRETLNDGNTRTIDSGDYTYNEDTGIITITVTG